MKQRMSSGAWLLCAGMVLLLGGPADAVDWMKMGQDLLKTTTETAPAATAGLTDSDITAGLKDALRVGSDNVVKQLGALDGFNADPAIHIPLPESMKSVQSALGSVGMAGMLDDLELRLNRAAEAATPEAKALFWNAIEQMTLEDVQGIYNGPDDAATRYFQGKMASPLGEKMKPIVDRTLNEVGAIQLYDSIMGQYASMPFVPDVKADLNQYVVDRGMDGIFHYLAQEETAIRQQPVKRTTEILQKVFGAP